MTVQPQTHNLELEHTLVQITVPDSKAVKDAEEKLKHFINTPDCVPLLFQQLEHSQQVAARQLSAILLRKRIGGFWKKSSPETKAELKRLLLDRLCKEPIRAVQTAIGGVVAAVAKYEIPLGQWNDLLEFLLQCSSHTETHFRELSLLLFRVLCDHVGSSLRMHFTTLIDIFTRALSDNSSVLVREESMRALGALFMSCEEDSEFLAYQSIVPGLCHVIQSAASVGDENAASFGLGLLDDLAESPVPILNPHVSSLATFALQITANADISMDVRERSCNLLVWLVKFHSKTFLDQPNLSKETLNACLHLLLQPAEDPDEVVNTEGVSSTQALALEVLDELFINLPTGLLYQPALEGAMQLCASADPSHRSSGLLVLFVMAEGCQEMMKSDLQPLLRCIFTSLRDSNQLVSANASSALAQCAEHLQPEILSLSSDILPELLKLTPTTRLMTTIDAFCSDLSEQQITPFLPNLVQLLLSLLEPSTPLDLQDRSLSALAAVATASKKSFSPFLDTFLQRMVNLMNISEGSSDELLNLSAQSIRTLGAIAHACPFPSLPSLLPQALQGLESSTSPEIKEAIFSLLAVVAELNASPDLLPQCIPFILASMDSNDGLSITEAGENDDDKDFGGVGFASDDEDDDEDAENGFKNLQYSIMSGYIDEKISALQALSAFLKFSPENMIQFLPEILESAENLSEYLHDSVRILALFLYDDIFNLIHNTWGNSDPQTFQISDSIFTVLVTSMSVEFEKGVASVAIDVLARAINTLGRKSLENFFLPILTNIQMVLEEKTPAQKYAREDACASPDDLDELMDSTSDLLAAIAQALGKDFSQHFGQLLPLLIGSLNSSSSPGQIATVLGAIGEVSVPLCEGIVPHLPQILPLISQTLSHPSPIVQRSALFAVGSLACSAGPALGQHINSFLPAIQQACSMQSSDPLFLAARDNAFSALVKIVTAMPQSVPQTQMIPVLLHCLPLQEDKLENSFVYTYLGKLVGEQAMGEHVQSVVSIMSVALSEALAEGSDESDESKRAMVNVVKALAQHHGPSLQSILQSFPPETTQLFQYVMSF